MSDTPRYCNCDAVIAVLRERAEKAEAERDAAIARAEGAEKDAARYRWLRQQHWSTGELAVARNPVDSIKLGYESPSLERLDAAIDAAQGSNP